MKYHLLSLIIFLLPAVGVAGENSSDFARYNSETRVLSLPEVGVIDSSSYFDDTSKIHLGINGEFEIIKLGKSRINEPYPDALPENYLPVEIQVYKFDSEENIIMMPLLEVDDEIAFKNVKLQLDFSSQQWRILEFEEESCSLTAEQAEKLHACMTLAEVEEVIGCAGIQTDKGGYLAIGKGVGGSYVWGDVSAIITSLYGILPSVEDKAERVESMTSSKYGISISFVRCDLQ